MKMPKGWKYLEKLYEVQHTSISRNSIINAAYFLKEMAEALEECNTALNNYKDIAEQEAKAVVLSYDVLKKFKEWK